MQKFILSIVFIGTLFSVGYFSLITFDMSTMLSKNWNHGQLLFLQKSTVASVISLLLVTSMTSYFLKSKFKNILMGINLILLLAWVLLLSFRMIGVIN